MKNLIFYSFKHLCFSLNFENRALVVPALKSAGVVLDIHSKRKVQMHIFLPKFLLKE